MTAPTGDAAPLRPLPATDGAAAPFWQAAREHRFVIQQCQDCARHHFPPEPGCYNCGSANVEWVEVSGRATLYSWTIAQPPLLPYFAARAPVPVVAVELAEGPRMVSSLPGVAPEDYRFDMPLQVAFEDAGEDTTLVVFRPA